MKKNPHTSFDYWCNGLTNGWGKGWRSKTNKPNIQTNNKTTNHIAFQQPSGSVHQKSSWIRIIPPSSLSVPECVLDPNQNSQVRHMIVGAGGLHFLKEGVENVSLRVFLFSLIPLSATHGGFNCISLSAGIENILFTKE